MAWAYDQNAKYVGVVTGVPDYDDVYTLSLWIRLNATPDDFFAVWQLYAGAADYEMLVVDNTGNLLIQVVYGGTLEEQGLGTVDDGGWHHVVLVRSGSDKITGWLDGTSPGDLTLSGTRSIPNTVMYFGCFAGSFFFLDGDIDSVKLWASAINTVAVQDEGAMRDIVLPTWPAHFFDPAGPDYKLVNLGTEAANLVEIGGTVEVVDGPPILAYPRRAPSVNAVPRTDRRGIYDAAREGFLDGSLSWTSDTIKAVAIAEGYVPDFSTHRDLADVPKQYRLATSNALTGKAATNGLATSSVAKFLNVTKKIEGVLLFNDTGSDSTSRLISFSNVGANLPSHPHGGDAIASWSGALFRI